VARKPPLDVVLIVSDDQRADTLGPMPRVRRLLAAHGVTFQRAFVTTSLCCPSRASILSGQYSHHHGVIENFGRASYPRFDEGSNLAVWLQAAGYETALVGKYLNDYSVYGRHRVPPGWSWWAAIDSRPEESYYDYRLNENGRLVSYGSAPEDYSTRVLAEKAVAFLRRAREPFFLYFAPVAPHLPALPAPRDRGSIPFAALPRTPSFNERDVRDKPWRRLFWHRLRAGALRVLRRRIERQLESLRALDRAVGALVWTLRQRHLLRRTVLLYTSDNGFLWGEHRLGGKLWPYEESIRVPLLVRVPWRSAWGRRDRHLVLNIDLAPTVAALAGARPELPEDGRSLLPLLHGRRPPWRRDFLVEYLGRSQLHRDGSPPFVGLRSERFLYVEYGNGWRELYDLARDPFELRNRAADPAYAPLRHALRRRLRQLLREPAHPAPP
jgi:arylsulfatase A-like enzyme